MAETRETANARGVKKTAPSPKGGGKKTCSVEGCKRGYRAKGLCFFHYRKWRRGEMEARPPRYDTCSKEACHKKVVGHGMCREHFDAWKTSRKSAKLSGAAAPAPAAEAPAAAETPAAG